MCAYFTSKAISIMIVHHMICMYFPLVRAGLGLRDAGASGMIIVTHSCTYVHLCGPAMFTQLYTFFLSYTFSEHYLAMPSV